MISSSGLTLSVKKQVFLQHGRAPAKQQNWNRFQTQFEFGISHVPSRSIFSNNTQDDYKGFQVFELIWSFMEKITANEAKSSRSWSSQQESNYVLGKHSSGNSYCLLKPSPRKKGWDKTFLCTKSWLQLKDFASSSNSRRIRKKMF